MTVVPKICYLLEPPRVLWNVQVTPIPFSLASGNGSLDDEFLKVHRWIQGTAKFGSHCSIRSTVKVFAHFSDGNTKAKGFNDLLKIKALASFRNRTWTLNSISNYWFIIYIITHLSSMFWGPAMYQIPNIQWEIQHTWTLPPWSFCLAIFSFKLVSFISLYILELIWNYEG